MALPPTIPTSFVPKQPVNTGSKKRSSGANPFMLLSYFVVSVAVVGCLAVFGYQYYLEGVAKKKANEVITAQNHIDQATVTEFIRLRDRFTASKDILNRHIVLSHYFDLLESLTLQGVRFTGLKLAIAEDRSGKVDMNGTAKSFNTLAAESTTFANEKRIKRAIFSGITSAKDGGVTFVLQAELDPSLVVIGGPNAQPTVPAPTTPAPAATGTTTTP